MWVGGEVDVRNILDVGLVSLARPCEKYCFCLSVMSLYFLFTLFRFHNVIEGSLITTSI
jgi:hypothetical protein